MKNKEYRWSHNHQDNSFKYLNKTINIITDSLNKNSKVIDIGCGNGYLTKKITKKFKNVVGVDQSKSAIKFAKKNYKGKIKFINSDLENLNLKKKFDIIFLIEVIEHVYSPDNLIKKIKKFMKKNTILIISTPYHGYFKNLLIALLNKFDDHLNPLWEHGHIKFWSKNTLSKLLNQNGLRIKKITYSGRFYPLSKSILMICEKY